MDHAEPRGPVLGEVEGIAGEKDECGSRKDPVQWQADCLCALQTFLPSLIGLGPLCINK